MHSRILLRFGILSGSIKNCSNCNKFIRCFSDDKVPTVPSNNDIVDSKKQQKQLDSTTKETSKKIAPRKIVVLKDPNNIFGKTEKITDDENTPQVIVGPDGVPYDPSEDPHYSNDYMMYKYPQYFTKYIGFTRAKNVVKEDMLLLKKGRIHKVREEIGCPNHVDICIFGGGIIGTSIAYFLREKAPFGVKVAVIERDPTYTRSSTTLSTGGLRQQFSLEENILMSLYSAEFIQNARKNLSIFDAEPPDVCYHPQGFLTLADESQAEELIKNHQRQIDLGCLVEIYNQERIKEKFPMINTDGVVLGSYGVQNEGWFDPFALHVALKAKAQFFGAEFVHADILDFNFKLDFKNDRTTCNYVVVREPNGEVRHVEFALGVIATGHNSAFIAKLLGYGSNEVDDWRRTVQFPIEPRKRYVYSFDSEDGPGINFPFLIDTTGTYCRREGLGGKFICGRSPSPNQEPETDNLDVDYSYFNENINPALIHRVPSFDPIKLKGAWAGFYDYNRIDQNPIIGQDPFFKNLIWATGFGGNGIQMAPAVGRAIMELLLYDNYKTIDLKKFGWERLFNNEPLKESYQY